MAHLALLVNPESGSGEGSDVERLLARQGAEVRRYGLDQVGLAIAERPRRLVVAGGDGSIAAAAEAAGRAGLPLGVIPAGTANDFARALGIPAELAPASALAALGSRLRSLDLCRIDARPFVNVASAGLPPLAAERAHGLKRALGSLAYVVGAVRVGVTARPLQCRVRCDGQEAFAGAAWQVTVAGTGAFGAGAAVDADPADGQLDVLVIEAGPRIGLIARAHGLRRGGIEGQRGVTRHRAAEVEVAADGDGGFNVDGELVAAASARFTIEPHAFRVVVG